MLVFGHRLHAKKVAVSLCWSKGLIALTHGRLFPWLTSKISSAETRLIGYANDTRGWRPKLYRRKSATGLVFCRFFDGCGGGGGMSFSGEGVWKFAACCSWGTGNSPAASGCWCCCWAWFALPKAACLSFFFFMARRRDLTCCVQTKWSIALLEDFETAKDM